MVKFLLSSIAFMLFALSNAGGYNVNQFCPLLTPGTKLPRLDSCKMYYICQSNGTFTEAYCVGNNEFSKDHQNCVPEKESNCYVGSTNPCKFKHKQFASSNQGCNMWNYCVNGKIQYTSSCPEGQIFDAVKSKCINGKCYDDNHKGDNIENVCQIMPSGQYFGAFDDCRTWNKCNGMAIKSGKCADDLVYDTKTGMCLKNIGTMCERINNDAVASHLSGPPAKACTNIDQVVGDTKSCSTYYTCKKTKTPATTYEWLENKCDNKYFDVFTKECVDTTNARPYPGCDRCQFTTNQQHWANAVDSNCRNYLTCKNGKNVNIQGSCNVGDYFNEELQGCVVRGVKTEYEINNGACHNYSCTTERECSLANEHNDNNNNSAVTSKPVDDKDANKPVDDKDANKPKGDKNTE